MISLCFYQTRSSWSVNQASNKNHSPAYNFAPTVTNMTQNLVTVGAKLWTAERFLVDPWSMDYADLLLIQSPTRVETLSLWCFMQYWDIMDPNILRVYNKCFLHNTPSHFDTYHWQKLQQNCCTVQELDQNWADVLSMLQGCRLTASIYQLMSHSRISAAPTATLCWLILTTGLPVSVTLAWATQIAVEETQNPAAVRQESRQNQNYLFLYKWDVNLWIQSILVCFFIRFTETR